MPMGFLAQSLPGTGWSAVIFGAILIFCARVADMSIDTLRVMSLVKGHRVRAAVFGFLEAGIFIVALAQVFRPPIHWLQMLGYASGFAVGTYVGSMLAAWTSAEYRLLRVISRPKGQEICDALRDSGFAVTEVKGEGRDGPVPILFSVVDRRHSRRALRLVRGIAPDAFVLMEPVTRPIGGFVPRVVGPGLGVRR